MAAAGAGGDDETEFQQYMVQGYFSDSSTQQVTVNWTVPTGVTSICAVAVGGGEPGEASNSDADGGNAGDLRYVNDISVTPGETLEIAAANGWWGDKNQADGGNSGKGGGSWIKRGTGSQATYLVFAQGGNGSGTNVGTGSNGTNGTDGHTSRGGGGGKSGDYDSSFHITGSNNGSSVGYSGGGVGISGSNENQSSWDSVGAPQTGGAGGRYVTSYIRGSFGGGGGGFNTDHANPNASSSGAPGAVRIIWGENRSFPSNAKGLYPTPSAGTKLEIRFMAPMAYDQVPTASTSASDCTVVFHGMQVIDDNGTNLWAYDGNGSSNNDYCSINTSFGSTEPGQTLHDFDDLSSLGTYGRIGANFYNLNFSALDFRNILDVDNPAAGRDWGMGPNKITASNMSSQYSESNWTTDNEDTFYSNVFCEFTNATVIKKIVFYGEKNYWWVPRCKILLDGKVIADDYPFYELLDNDDGDYDDEYYMRKCSFEFTD